MTNSPPAVIQVQDTVSHAKASPLILAANATSEDAFSAIISACLSHATANQPAVLAGQSEGVHQMRVAFRRLRSGLKLFRRLIPRTASTGWVTEIRWLNSALGPARDWDVFLEGGLGPLLARFPHKRSLRLFRATAERVRQAHYGALRAALADPRYPQLLSGLATWLEQCAWRAALDAAQRHALTKPVLAFATPHLDRAQRRVIQPGERFVTLDAAQRHALRIRIKELRYALDFFASLYAAPTVKSYLGALSQLQDHLGLLNDAVVASRLLDEARLATAAAARQVLDGWYGYRLYSQERAFNDLWQNFSACARPWRGD